MGVVFGAFGVVLGSPVLDVLSIVLLILSLIVSEECALEN